MDVGMKQLNEKRVNKMLKLKNGYKVEYDGTQYKLLQDYKKMTAKEKGSKEMIEVSGVKTIGYHSNLESCLNQYIRECIATKIQFEELELKDVKNAMGLLKAEIKYYGGLEE